MSETKIRLTNFRAAVLEREDGPFRFKDLHAELRAGEVLVRIEACGICHTDLAVRKQALSMPLPAVLGHEGAGIVEAVGEGVGRLKVGDRVVLSYAYCGNCTNCQRAQYSCCSHARLMNFGGIRLGDRKAPYRDNAGNSVSGFFFGQSSFGSHALTYENNAHLVPEDIPLSLAAALGCGVQTGAGTVLNTLKPEPGSSLAVFGTGSVGLSAIMAARATGCTDIIAVDLNPSRLELARSLGATHLINPLHQDVAREIQAATADGCQYAIDTTGASTVIRSAVEALRPTGTCVLISSGAAGTEITLPLRMLISGRTVRGVVQGNSISSEFIPALVRLWRQGRFPFEKLITRYPMDAINEAMADMEEGRVVKPILCNA